MGVAVERFMGGMGAALSPTLQSRTVALLALNLVDALFTLVFLQLGFAEEANPFMRVAYEQSPLTFMMVKVLLVPLGVMLLAMGPQRAALRALTLAVSAYALVVTWHLAFLARLA
jgi:hypothetical protein